MGILEAVDREIEWWPGESLYIDFDFTRELRSGQTVVSATYEAESPATMDGGTSAVDEDGKIAQARFTVPDDVDGGTRLTVQCAALCTNPVETRHQYAVIVVVAEPE